MNLKKKIIKIEFEDRLDFIKAISFADPERQVHLILTDQEKSFFFYGNSNEFLFTRDKLEAGYFAFENEQLKQVQKMDKVGPVYFVSILLKRSDFDGVVG